MEFCALASGSSGNCIYVGSGSTALLVDAGISGKKTDEALNGIGVSPEKVQGLLITHEHSDHIKSAAVLVRKYGFPIYGTEATLEYIFRSEDKEPDPSLLRPIKAGETFRIGDIDVHAFPISHDALDPVSYVLEADGRKLGMATDLGVFTEDTVNSLKDSDALYIEANYDYSMLMVGHYPYALKQRIASPLGHLSNDMSAELIMRLQHEKLKTVVLAHLSKDNNFEELAYETVRAAMEREWKYENLPRLLVARRYIPTGLIQL